MTPQQFIATWKKAQLSERSAAQQHFSYLPINRAHVQILLVLGIDADSIHPAL